MDRPLVARIFYFDVFLLSVCVLGAIAALVVHEVLGHCVTAALLGAKVHGVSLGVMSGGLAHYDLPPGAGTWRTVPPLAGGIVAELLLGVAALVFARRASVPVRLGLVCFGGIALLSSLGYTATGLYFGWGDPGKLAELLGVRPSALVLHESRLWIPFALAAVPVAALAARQYVDVQDQLFPVASVRERFVRAASTIGLVIAVVAVLQVTIGAATNPVPPRLDLRREVVQGRRVVAAARSLRTEMPGATDDEVRRLMEARVPEILAAPITVPPNLPVDHAFHLTVLLTGAATVLVARKRAGTERAEIAPRAALATAAAAIVVGSLIAVAG